MTFTLRPYQQEAIDGLYRYWQHGLGDHPLIVAPTGSGKTAIIAQLVRDAMSFPDTRVMILTHVKELLEQGAEGLLRMYPEADFGFYSAGIGQKRTDKPITFAGIQSVWEKASEFIPAPDLILIDEAHMLPRNANTRYAKFINDMQQCNPQVKIVGLTATPYRLDSGMLHEGKDRLFDGIAHDIPVADLMEQGYLCPVISKGGLRQIDLSGVKKRGGEFVEADLARAASDPELVAATVTEIVTLGADRNGWLVFSSGVDHANMLADGIREHGHSVGVVTGDLGSKERAQILSDFKAGRLRCIVNCNVLTTGFDAPNVDLVAIVRATASTGLYVQIVGRGTRLHPDKEDCLILDYGDNVARHGFIDQIKPKRAGGSGDGEAPVKACPDCQTYLPTAVRVCPSCGHQFPEPELNHGQAAYGGAMMSNQVENEWLDVTGVDYARWKKRGGDGTNPDTLRVTYHCGLTSVSEWLCPDHGGYAASKYRARRAVLGATADTLTECLEECDGWNVPGRILVRPDGNFHKIMQFDYSTQPVIEVPAHQMTREDIDAMIDEIPF